MKRVLITGAAGQIGRCLRSAFKGVYEELRLADIAPQAPAQAGETILRTDIRDMAQLEVAMKDIDCVVHLAGIPVEGPWETVRDLNIDGCYNAYEAAYRQGVKRFIFASSNHAIGFHRRETIIDSSVVPRPDTRYGASKVFGEALGRLYADKHGLSVGCLRIGTFREPDEPSESRQLLTWISHRDMAQLVQRCIDHPDYHYLVAYGVSNNKRSRWSNADVDFLGYRPQDDSETFAPAILAKGIVENPIAARFHGGFFCPLEFDGDLERID
ncbi:MAG: NAD(P)-dependent oxidoreductase [Burkholderiaceae bacterium]